MSLWAAPWGALTLGLAILLASPFASASSADLRQALADYTAKGRYAIGSTELASGPFLEQFYAKRDFQPAWTSPIRAAELAFELRRMELDGLMSEDANRKQVIAAIENPSAYSPADYDLLLSDSLLRLLYLLNVGKVDPAKLDPDWSLAAPILDQEAVGLIEESLSKGSVSDLVERARPHGVYYASFKAALASYREIASSGGWGQVDDGEGLRPGERSPRVRQLRARLSRSADYHGVGYEESDLFDEALAEAVKVFQRRHGIEPDGIVGKTSLGELNVSVEQRIQQILVNMERARWVDPALGESYIIVNIAGFYLKLIRHGEEIWETRVVVGAPFFKTPVFSEDLLYMEFNPTWTPTRKIAVDEILPKLREDPDYLAQQNFDLVDDQRNPVPSASIDWRSLKPETFRHWFVQRPGPNNALGQVKFLLPNKHAVYLHDTPSKSLFDKTSRTFSHGCIRVEHPLTLAELLLKDQAQWTQSRIAEVVQSGETTRVNLTDPLPVLLLYWTIDPDLSGAIRFYPDVYGRDETLAEALKKPLPVLSN